MPEAKVLMIEKSLEQKLAEKQSAKTVWDSDKKDWVNVSIPRENAIGELHAAIELNGESHRFEAGQTYLVPLQVADFLKDRLEAYRRSCVRIYRPDNDTMAEAAVDRWGTATAMGGRGTREVAA